MIVMVLLEYGTNDNIMRVWEKVNWMICHSDCKYLHQRILLGIHQFSEPGQQGISDCEPCYHCLYFEEDGIEWNSFSLHKTH